MSRVNVQSCQVGDSLVIDGQVVTLLHVRWTVEEMHCGCCWQYGNDLVVEFRLPDGTEDEIVVEEIDGYAVERYDVISA